MSVLVRSLHGFVLVGSLFLSPRCIIIVWITFDVSQVRRGMRF